MKCPKCGAEMTREVHKGSCSMAPVFEDGEIFPISIHCKVDEVYECLGCSIKILMNISKIYEPLGLEP